MYSKEKIDEVVEASDIVDIISSYIPLKKSGASYKAVCPFHTEKTPSFFVHPAKQMFYCFGCAVGGNVVNFIMLYEKFNFPEAVKLLAEKTGIYLPDVQNDTMSQSSKEKEELLKVHRFAVDFYSEILFSNKDAEFARKYLIERRISSDTIKKFKLGYALPGWDNFYNIAVKKFSSELLQKSGLVAKSENKNIYDRFRDRIIFPIFDIAEKPVGFGGRILNNGEPKYLNSPETLIYHKGDVLYGLNFAKDEIRKQDKIIIVEGYFDAITSFQEGITNTVATLGTALTTNQAKLIKRYANNAVMAYDVDTAGILAGIRGVEVLVENSLNVEVASMPEGKDPDGFLKMQGKDSYLKVLSQAENFVNYRLNLAKKKSEVKDIKDKLKVISELLRVISKMESDIEKGEYIKRISQELIIEERLIWLELDKINAKSFKPSILKSTNTFLFKDGLNIAERDFVQLMLEDKSNIEYAIEKTGIISSDFSDAIYSKIIKFLYENKETDVAQLINKIDDEDIKNTILKLTLSQSRGYTDMPKAIESLSSRIKSNAMKMKIHELKGQEDFECQKERFEMLKQLKTDKRQTINCRQ